MEKPNTELEKIALDHAWDWFEYHANQRMTMIRFYLTVSGAIATGVAYLWIAHQYLLCACLCAFGTIASFCFMRIDNRVSALIKLGEAALKGQQAAISQRLGDPEFAICDRADDTRTATGRRRYAFPHSYSENFGLMFWVVIVALIGTLIVSVVTALGAYGAYCDRFL
jgi:hypothetical protein